MTERLCIRGASLWNGSEWEVRDLQVIQGKIAAIAENLVECEGEVVDAGGLLMLPGVIDAHVHFREPGLEHKEDFASAVRLRLLAVLQVCWRCPTVVRRQPHAAPCRTSSVAPLGVWHVITHSLLVRPGQPGPACRARADAGCAGIKISWEVQRAICYSKTTHDCGRRCLRESVV